ncbi:MAG TPA: hypothetical protein VGL38_08745 [bacterium]
MSVHVSKSVGTRLAVSDVSIVDANGSLPLSLFVQHRKAWK